jgi:DNA topoisomerase IB
VALAVSAPAAIGSKTGRARAIKRAIEEVAGYLGNTPAVCRASYIDPRVFDRFRSGWTIAGVLPEMGDLADPDVRLAVEAGVLDLLEDERSSDALEKGLQEAA